MSGTTFPPSGPTSLKDVIPAYVYEQYSDDDNIQALFMAYNDLAQQYLDWFNAVNLPVYTSDTVAGDLLDWVAEGLYGISRRPLALLYKKYVGPFNTYPINTIAFNAQRLFTTTNTFPVTDDVFKRVITWNFYKGDGFVFSISWLKRRIVRWLIGVNGTAPPIADVSSVSVSISGSVVTVNIAAIANPLAPVLVASITTGFCALPFQFTYNVTVV